MDIKEVSMHSTKSAGSDNAASTRKNVVEKILNFDEAILITIDKVDKNI